MSQSVKRLLLLILIINTLNCLSILTLNIWFIIGCFLVSNIFIIGTYISVKKYFAKIDENNKKFVEKHGKENCFQLSEEENKKYMQTGSFIHNGNVYIKEEKK